MSHVRPYSVHVDVIIVPFLLLSLKCIILDIFPFAVTGEWSLPLQYGFEVSGRMGHTSSYNRDEGLVYVYGGNIRGSTGGMILDELLTFDPACYVWSSLEAR